LVRVPDGVSDDQAILLSDIFPTAWFGARLAEVGSGDTVLVLGAGVVGQFAIASAKRQGAGRVIVVDGIASRLDLARAQNAETVDFNQEDPVAVVRELTGGEGVAVAYDSVGRTTFDASLAALGRRGMMVLFGAASGPVPPFDPQRLAAGGSLFLTRPTLRYYIATREELLWRAGELFDLISQGQLKVRIDREFPLADAADAHIYMQERRTRGKVLLVP
jgi:NADPH2:quinone reductase